MGQQVFSLLPGTPANPQFFEIVYKGHMVMSNGLSKPVVQIYHVRRDDTIPTPPALNDLITAFKGVVDTALSAALSEKYVGDEVSARAMDDPSTAAYPSTNDLVGAITGDRATGFNAVTVRLQTVGRGRNYRGSKHYGPVAESDTTLDNLNSAALTRWGAVVDALVIATEFTDADGRTYRLCVLSRDLSDLTANPALFSGADVNNALLNSRIGRMVRRQERATTPVG